MAFIKNEPSHNFGVTGYGSEIIVTSIVQKFPEKTIAVRLVRVMLTNGNLVSHWA